MKPFSGSQIRNDNLVDFTGNINNATALTDLLNDCWILVESSSRKSNLHKPQNSWIMNYSSENLLGTHGVFFRGTQSSLAIFYKQ